MLHVLHVPHDVAAVHPLKRLHYAASREAAGRAAEGASGPGGLILLTDQRWFLSSAQQQQFWASSTKSGRDSPTSGRSPGEHARYGRRVSSLARADEAV